MKAINVVKRIVATGMGLTMVGATIFGASAAYSLSDFPKPFVENGTPASNLAIVVGENAAATDVAGAVDIALALQAAAVTKVPIPGAKGGVSVEGDAVAIGSTSNLLDIDQLIGAVRETLTEVDLDMLKGGQVVTDQGSTEYNQYLRLPTAGASGKVIFGKDERDRVGHYLKWAADDQLFEWQMEFEEGLKSKVKNDRLTDFEDQDLLILGQPFVVVNSDISFEPTGTAGRLKLDLMGGAISAILGENDKETYTVDGKEYEVEVLVISETSNSGAGSVKFRINGEITDELSDGETDVLADGTQIGIRDIIATGKDIQKSVVQFYLGAYKISFEDRNISDTNNQTAGASVNEEIITKSKVQMRGRSIATSGSAGNVTVKTAELQNIKYFLDADSVLGDIYVPPGSGVREQLQTPESMLTPAWDIVYQGLTDTGTTTIVLDPRGNDEYNLQFTNQEGIFYDIPYLSNRAQTPALPSGEACLKFGDFNDDLWFIEAANTQHSLVTKRDFFVLSNCDVGSTDNTCFSHVLRYDSIDTTNNKLTFTDLGTGTRDVTFDNSTRLAQLVVGGVVYNMYVDGVGPYNLSIDLNGDGDVAGDQAYIGIQGDGLLSLGSNNTNASGANGSIACATTLGAAGSNLADNVNLTLTTLAKEFDESGANENITISIVNRTGNTIGIGANSLKNVTGTLFGLFTLEENEDLQQGLSGYGVFFEEFVPTGNTEAESLTVEYPLSQRGGEVFITGGAVTTTVSETGFAEKVNPIPTTVSMQDSDVDDITRYNAIVVGGACANTVAAGLVGNPEPCWSSVPENKAVVKAFEHDNGNVAILVAGFSAKDTRRATMALAAGKLADVKGDEAEVSGTSLT
ncbi:hypothetical protein HY485_03970, partial [Candidatus Woesearchaeota archaeon]|nr:hypothetical protein [Candidatus Woesearchaeota archaeon]